MMDFLLTGPLAPVFRFIFLNVMHLIQDGMIFKPDKPQVGKIEPMLHPSQYKKYNLAGIEEKNLRTSDGINITTWYKPASSGKPTFLYLPGNTGHFGDCGCGLKDDGTVLETGRDYRLAMLQEFVKSGVGILAICYRGFGTSSGRPSEEGLIEDVRAAWQLLLDEAVNPRDIIVYGDSLGGAVAFSFVATISEPAQPAVVITTGTFVSIAHKANDQHPQISIEQFRPYINHMFDSHENIQKLGKTKIILMHGTNDKTTYPYHSEILANKAREARLDVTHIPVQGAGHIDIDPKRIIVEALGAHADTRKI